MSSILMLWELLIWKHKEAMNSGLAVVLSCCLMSQGVFWCWCNTNHYEILYVSKTGQSPQEKTAEVERLKNLKYLIMCAHQNVLG